MWRLYLAIVKSKKWHIQDSLYSKWNRLCCRLATPGIGVPKEHQDPPRILLAYLMFYLQDN